jgi:HK97 family phage portal protein
MSFLARPFARRSDTSSMENPAAWLVNWFSGGPATASGVRVNPDSALRATAVYACVRVLAETISSLSLQIYRRRADGGKELVREHPVFDLLHTAPNEEMTSAEWRETVMGANALRGNGYSQIRFRPDGRPGALWPLHPDRVTIRRDLKTRELRYDYVDEDGRTVTYRHGEVLHERSFGGNGIIGHSPIRQAAEAVGISLAAEEHGARFFSNGANPSGVLQSDKTMSDEAYARLRKSFADQYAGLHNSRKPILLEDGFKWQGISMNHEQSQFIETRQYQVEDIARIFRVPPHLIGHLLRSTNNNIEHQSIEFAMYTMLPWCTRKEQRYNQSLFLPSERAAGYFAQFNLDTLLRGDAKSRAEALQILRFNGVINANEWRALDNRNPYEGGDRYLVQAAMVPVEDVGKNFKAPAAVPAEKKRLAEVFLPVVLAGAQRALRKELKALRAAAKRPDTLPAAIGTFYADHRTYVTEQIGPAFESLGLALGVDLAPQARRFTDAFCDEQKRLAEAAASEASAFEALLNMWEQKRHQDFASRALTAVDAALTGAASAAQKEAA